MTTFLIWLICKIQEQVSTWEKMNLMLEPFDDLENKMIILEGNFNLSLHSEAEGGYTVLKFWDIIQYEYNLTDKEKIWWLQQVHALRKLWEEALNKDLGVSVNLAIYDHDLFKKLSVVRPR